MKFLLLAFTIVGVAAAAVFEIPTNEYLPPSEQVEHVSRVGAQPIEEFLPPVLEAPQPLAEPEKQNSAVLAEDGYHYKGVRRIKYRHRRDVNKLPNKKYLSPIKQHQIVVEPQDFATAVMADQLSKKYLPPHQQTLDISVSKEPEEEFLPPVLESPQILNEPEQQHTAILAADGYHYKVGYRQRRDLHVLQSNELLPTHKQYQIVAEPEEIGPQQEAPQVSAVLADDGYRYKVVRSTKYRQRRV